MFISNNSQVMLLLLGKHTFRTTGLKCDYVCGSFYKLLTRPSKDKDMLQLLPPCNWQSFYVLGNCASNEETHLNIFLYLAHFL